MRSKTVAGLAIMMVLSAFADRPHDLFKMYSDKILSSSITDVEDTVFIVGNAKYQGIGGDSVGWTKAEAAAMWCLGDRFKETARWSKSATEEEKREAWAEYRASKINNFRFSGLQRVFSKKIPPDNYLLVLSVPSNAINLTPPSNEDLNKALVKVRERIRVAKEAQLREARRIEEEKEAQKRRAGYREESLDGVKQQQVDEDLIL